MISPLFFNPRTEQEKKEQREQIRRFLNIEKLKVKLNDEYFESKLNELKLLEQQRKATEIALLSKKKDPLPDELIEKISGLILSEKLKKKTSTKASGRRNTRKRRNRLRSTGRSRSRGRSRSSGRSRSKGRPRSRGRSRSR